VLAVVGRDGDVVDELSSARDVVELIVVDDVDVDGVIVVVLDVGVEDVDDDLLPARDVVELIVVDDVEVDGVIVVVLAVVGRDGDVVDEL
jgi:hypothetical protein